ncbi:hypothetical protein BDN70DRAFT_933530 [Pholiota conissans]|uniref:NACHT domain-containing protein n=1 Tax=Pholiota conissans TaxID=109636 RepID=A0A9P6CTA7_9AGAR|nr:hypothetical protein BDN70DRAFT_933530 [Pholiota conissans]
MGPLLSLRERKTFTIIIDTLDECIDHMDASTLIRVSANIISKFRNAPVIFLFASRPMAHIESEFNIKEVANLSKIISLEETEASDDINQYVTDNLAKIKRDHLLRDHLPSEWPATWEVKKIVMKSSGIFSVASEAIKFISLATAHPITQLEIIVNGSKCPLENPFAGLDDQYSKIFSQIPKGLLERVLDVLAYILITNESRIKPIEAIFMLKPGGLATTFAHLAAVIRCRSKNDEKLKFVHTLLPEFLLNPNRAKEYHIDLKEYCTKLLCVFLKMKPKDQFSPNALQECWRLQAIKFLLLSEKTKSSKELRCALMQFDIATERSEIDHDRENAEICTVILRRLDKMDFNDRGRTYRHIVDQFAKGYAIHWSSLADDVKEELRKSQKLVSRIRKRIPQEEYL